MQIKFPISFLSFKLQNALSYWHRTFKNAVNQTQKDASMSKFKEIKASKISQSELIARTSEIVGEEN